MKLNLTLLLFISFFVSFFSVPVIHVQAQGVPSLGPGIDLSVSSTNPVPGQKITVTAHSYNSNINSSMIVWMINGVETLKGVGETTLYITAPDLGKKLNISVTTLANDGARLNGSITIITGTVDMIIENNGYVPPFFKGKSSVAYQNIVKIIAVPHLANSSGVEYDPKTLVYQWKKNSQVVEDQSGYGKQSISIAGDIVPREYSVTVNVSTRDNTSRTAGYAEISFDSPSLAFYVDDSLYGPLFNKSVSDVLRIGSNRETGVLMVPFGFNKPLNDIGNLSLNWMINNIMHPELSKNQSITLRAPTGEAGNSDIRLSITNTKDILQGADASFSVIFSANNANNSTAAQEAAVFQ